MRAVRSGVWLAVASVVAASVVGCSGPTTPATFTEIYPLIFPRETKAQCNFCHALPANDISNGMLSMGTDRATAYAAIVGVASVSSKCAGRSLVVVGQPDSSLFLQKLGASPPCGGHMPLGGDALTATELEMVQTWIEAGAKND